MTVTATKSSTHNSSNSIEGSGQDSDGGTGESASDLETGDSPGMGILAGAAGVLGTLGALAARDDEEDAT